jgi:hypothetical protein
MITIASQASLVISFLVIIGTMSNGTAPHKVSSIIIFSYWSALSSSMML